MKKTLRLAAALSLACALTANAETVSQQRAGQIAQLYVSQYDYSTTGLTVKSVETLSPQLYLVNFSPKGFAIVSSDDAATPIVGYSTESNLSTTNMPDNMAYMVGEADKMVKNSLGSPRNSKWTRIERGTVAMSRGGEPVADLIKVKWNQGKPYNQYCPGEGSSKALVGCVAVAMSQAMSVQRYPERPNGFVRYNCDNYGQLSLDFDKESAYNWDDIISGTNSYSETARLLYHAGLSVSMGYGSDGSGIPSNQVYRITNALKNNFGYGKDVEYFWRSQYSGNWQQLLLNELYSGRAIVYNAIDTKGGYGHSFNIDGYNGDLFHLNWGWGGSGNGYFAIDALADAEMSMNYDSSHVAVVGIGAPNSALRSLHLSDQYVEDDTTIGSPFSAVLVNGEIANDALYSVEITGQYDSSSGRFEAVPFSYNAGLLSLKESVSATQGSIFLRVVVTDKATGVKMTSGFDIAIDAPQPIEHRMSLTYDRETKMFTGKAKFGSSYVVKNAQGNIVTSGSISANPYFEFSRSLLTTGENTIEVTNAGKSKVLKIKL